MDKEQIQKKLEKEAIKCNGGMCESYSYCKFCKEPRKFNRESITPCADALIDMKDINRMLKNYINNKAKIATLSERINIWNKALEENENIFTNTPESTFGMPRAKNRLYSPVESEAIRNELNRKQAEELIKIAKSEKNLLEMEIRKLDIAFNILSPKEMFLIECKYYENLDWCDIEISYNKNFNKELTQKRLQNKLSNIKTKLLGVIKTNY